jgi:hypothetical protein
LFHDFSELTLWSSDFHISPVADIKYFLRAHFNVSVIDKSLSSHCHFTETCATFSSDGEEKEEKNPLEILTRGNGISLEPCPNQIKSDFYESYRKKHWFEETVDGFLCLHAMALCEVYMAFGKPLIAIASTRFLLHSASIRCLFFLFFLFFLSSILWFFIGADMK